MVLTRDYKVFDLMERMSRKKKRRIEIINKT